MRIRAGYYKPLPQQGLRLPKQTAYDGLVKSNMLDQLKLAVSLCPDMDPAYEKICALNLAAKIKRKYYNCWLAFSDNKPRILAIISNIGKSQMEEKNYKEARDTFAFAIEKAQLLPDNRGKTLLLIDLYSSRAETFKLLGWKKPEIVDQKILAGLFADLGNKSAASARLLRCAELDVLCGFDEIALLSLEDSLKYNPRNAEAWLKMGEVYCKLEEYQEATFCFEKALRESPANRPLRGQIFYAWAINEINSVSNLSVDNIPEDKSDYILHLLDQATLHSGMGTLSGAENRLWQLALIKMHRNGKINN